MAPEVRGFHQRGRIAQCRERRRDGRIPGIFIQPLPDSEEQREEDDAVEYPAIEHGRGRRLRAHARVRRLSRCCSQTCSTPFMTVAMTSTNIISAYMV